MAVAALLVVVAAASGTSPVRFVPRTDDSPPRPADNSLPVDLQAPGELPDLLAVPFTVFLVVLMGLVLFGLVGIVLAVELPRWRRRRGTRGVEVGETVQHEQAVVRRVEKALQEFTAHPDRAPKDAVMAAWLALEETRTRKPHETATEFTQSLGVNADVLRNLYQRARFGHEEVTARQADEARDELGRIIRELA
ncbi:hypothetical protein BBK82_10220 [Lentzea guizhouensis]|uniref:Protein-glutamine gamma-glutamyltransferase-like C-terminal domain-containing protein n=1 Tax=Lentzea guizhouensis TaxID=1586287 RepID=A0A1B2HF89_9PSEU|nr:hypothetical protein BBK82_10220 [Lentzea guizhouensis]